MSASVFLIDGRFDLPDNNLNINAQEPSEITEGRILRNKKN